MSDRLAELRDVVPDVSRETLADLIAFEALFQKWSKSINLASPATLDQLWSRHILDSAQLFSLAPGAQRWLDLGSGGGFPGIVLALILKAHDGRHIDLVESNMKKAAFLRTALGQFRAPATVHAQRIEDTASLIKDPDIITARALASLNDLLRLAQPWLAAGATALFQKGRDYRREIDECRDAWTFDLVEHRSAIDQDSVILQISNVQRY
ncbi:16S rRNA (guanine(527)-N(7))-methyltransferase RsmG [Phyllobacterium sp. 0TCS1.6A]|uniref:16S rRNA (guanine(527)-N(7))-methyltransferase RsmG n=1 Tax=Phyllobacterium sp. 0TCS1.6A TaxID=2995637 RepID=UPI00226437F8|nr:16S rRNA (guanine(527)-N(7))-methyltransferase RsmG [Phyllobacterium sp. 0TCS1.6A]MCX8293291.1 16S rRNA (guanine(527)-N(7))-methyltransferase RsmG [Phyllobacterium sp. 0TCS1.6A]